MYLIEQNLKFIVSSVLISFFELLKNFIFLINLGHTYNWNTFFVLPFISNKAKIEEFISLLIGLYRGINVSQT